MQAFISKAGIALYLFNARHGIAFRKTAYFIALTISIYLCCIPAWFDLLRSNHYWLY